MDCSATPIFDIVEAKSSKLSKHLLRNFGRIIEKQAQQIKLLCL